jgi:RNA polymerase sigma-70 factor, ECF subfamily
VSSAARRARFEETVLVHIDAAYRLARWLTRDEFDAEEAVQESCLRAFRYFDSLKGDDALPWLLGIVRNTCYTLAACHRAPSGSEPFDEETCGEDTLAAGAAVSFAPDPETAAIESARRELVQASLRSLPPQYREVLVLRELNDCSYREIAAIVQAPVGTVMSRLTRARRLLRTALAARIDERKTGT